MGQAVPVGFLEYAVRGFFANGGESCVVLPLREPELTRKRCFDTLAQLFRQGGRLEDVADIDLVCVPDIVKKDPKSPRNLFFERADVFALQRQLLEHCKRMGDRFAILDTLPIFDGRYGAQTELSLERAIEGHWRELVPTDGALYYPWIRVEPLPGADSCVVPPCGHIAGIYARTDAQFGVHKAPANEIVEGALDLEVQLTDEEQGKLNDVGVNCIRSFPRRGIRLWGARTLSGLPNWRYVHVRRLFLTLNRWIEQHMRDVVFEPNGPPLWARVRDRLGAYCNELFQRGALKGTRPDEAFFVKCDAETNPLEVREAGQLICNIGLAPLMPAEFIVVRLTQSAAGTTVMLPLGV
jgi:phage tail sheath protein FI